MRELSVSIILFLRLMRKMLTLFLLLSGVNLTFGNGEEQPSVKVYHTNEKIVLDGVLDESIWQKAQPADNFWQYFPTDSLRAQFDTEISFAYDESQLYIGIKCYSKDNKYIVPSLKRDYRAGGNDNITLLFDSFADGNNAIMFGMNPYGVRREALISDGGNSRESFNTGWDNKWDGESKIHEGYWVAEMAIPFKTLRFKDGTDQWRFNCYRFDTQSNEQSVWYNIPQNQSIYSLAFMGDMNWEQPLKKSGSNISLIPYLSGSWSEETEDGRNIRDAGFGMGGDAKIAVTSGLNLDLTINPDFSQVEVDRQVTNLSRFEIFFPERRQFFIENQDLFSGFGKSRANPFFSRRIGIVEDTLTGNNIENPIIAGARLSGKITKDLRVGLLNMTTAQDRQNGLPSFNYTVASLQRRVFNRSNIGLIFVNKEALNPSEEDLFDPYNRVVGIDYNHLSNDNKWVGKAYVHRAFIVDNLDDKWSFGSRMEYKVRKIRSSIDYNYVGDNFDAQVGFVPRRNFFVLSQELEYIMYPKADRYLNSSSFEVSANYFFQPGFGHTDREISFGWNGRPSMGGRLSASVEYESTFLFDDFDPTRSDATPLPGNNRYDYTSLRFSYSTDRRRSFSFNVSPSIGEFYNGFRTGVRGSFDYRFQPLGQVSIQYNYNYIDLPEPYAQTSLFLIGPRIDLTFSKKLFFTTVVQYNSQSENMNINARLQWRFKPVSDFYLVYSNNYYTGDFTSTNRALIAKATYWLNL
jgi:hypothetical protein